MLLGYAFLAERAGARAWLGSAVAVGGVLVLAGPAALSGTGGYRAIAGAGLVLAGTLAFGAYTIVLRPLSQAYGAVRATAASTVVGALPYLAFAGDAIHPSAGCSWPRRSGASSRFSPSAARWPGCCCGTWPCFRPGSTRVSLLLYLEPVVSVLGAVLFLGERVTVAMLAGGLLHPGRRSRGQHALPNLQEKASSRVSGARLSCWP